MCGACGRLCAYEIFPKDLHGPAEYCMEDAVEGSEYCAEHDPELHEPDWDDRRKDTGYDCE